MTASIALIGVPTALGGHLAGMELAPAGLRQLGLVERLRARVPDAAIVDAGDLSIEPGFRPDDDPRAKNRGLVAEFLPRERDLVGRALGGAGAGSRLLIIGGDCTSHAGAMAGLPALPISCGTKLPSLNVHSSSSMRLAMLSSAVRMRTE